MHNDRQTRHRRQRQRGRRRWFLDQAYVSFDHPFNAPVERTPLSLDFVNEAAGPESVSRWS
ncbi:MAG: DUF6295 family protein [Caldilineaceae bacterium]